MSSRNYLRSGWARAIALPLVLFLPLASAHAQSGNITVGADASGSSCSIADVTPATFTVFVLHTNFNGATADFLSVTESAGFTATFVAENIPYYHAGTFRDGVTVVYGECVISGPLLIGTITYQGYGTSAACTKLDTAANPQIGFPTSDPVSENCSFSDYQAPSLGPLYINASSECPPPCVVRTQPTTWGSVKALYRR
jgi:hypothetical protein